MFRILINGRVVEPETVNVGAKLVLRDKKAEACQLFIFKDSHLINIESDLAITVDESGEVTMQ